MAAEVPPEAPLLGLWGAVFSLGLRSVCVCVLSSPSCKDISHTGVGPIQMPLVLLGCHFKD